MALPRDAETSLMRIIFDSRSPRWCTRSVACLTTSVAISPPKLISTTTSSASKSSWHFTAASPHCAGDPVVVRSASTANLPSFNNADFIAAARWIDANGDLLDYVLGHVVMDQPLVLKQRVHGVEDHRAL